MEGALFTIVGAIFVVVGLAAALDIAGAAGVLARYNAATRDSPQRERDLARSPHSTYPESRRGVRMWGVVAIVMGLVCVAVGLTS